MGKSFNKKRRALDVEKIKMSLVMDPREQKILDEMLIENNDDYIRRKLIQKYNAYYRHWTDFTILTAIFAVIALFLAIYQWENEWPLRGVDGRTKPGNSFLTDTVTMLVSIMGAMSIIIKFYFESVWMNFKNPIMFYKQLVQQQVE